VNKYIRLGWDPNMGSLTVRTNTQASCIGDINMKAGLQSSQFDLADNMHGHMHTLVDTGNIDYIK
jgi:hypothetical protein